MNLECGLRTARKSPGGAPGRNSRRSLACLSMLALLGAAVFGGAAKAERICVEEAAGVCLKYRDAKPEAPKPATPTTPARPASPEEAAEAAIRMTQEERRKVQEGLRARGLYDGIIDGAFGEGSRRAIARWQIDQGAASTGFLTLDQFRALSLSPSMPPAPALQTQTPPAATAGDPAPGKTYRRRMPDQPVLEHVVEVVRLDEAHARIRLIINGPPGYGVLDKTCDVEIAAQFTCRFRKARWPDKVIGGQLPVITIQPSGNGTKSSTVKMW